MAFPRWGSEDLGLTHDHIERMFWNTGMKEPTFLNKHASIRVHSLCVLHGLFFTPTRLGLRALPQRRDCVFIPSAGVHRAPVSWGATNSNKQDRSPPPRELHVQGNTEETQGLGRDGQAAEHRREAADPSQAHPDILLRERWEPPREPKAGRSRQRRRHRPRSGVKCHPATLGA